MDTTRTFEQSELTQLIVGALRHAVDFANDYEKVKGYLLTSELHIKQYKELLERIINEKMDVKLVSREY